MALGLSTGAVDKLFDTVFLQTMFNTGFVRIYASPRPANANDVVGAGALLAELPVAADSFAAASGKTLVGNTPWAETSAIVGGQANWFRLTAVGDTGASSTTEARIDGDVAASGSDLNLSTITIAALDQVTITQFDLSA